MFSQVVWMSPSPSWSSASTCEPSTLLPWESVVSTRWCMERMTWLKYFLILFVELLGVSFFVCLFFLLLLCYLSHWRHCPLWDFPIIASCSCYHDFISSHNSLIGSHRHSNHPVAQPASVGQLSLFFDRGKKSHFKNTWSHMYILTCRSNVWRVTLHLIATVVLPLMHCTMWSQGFGHRAVCWGLRELRAAGWCRSAGLSCLAAPAKPSSCWDLAGAVG